MKTTFAIIGVILVLLFVVGLPIFFNATPMGKAMWNGWFHEVQKADDNTRYETRKKVEDTCRAMMASYQADKLTYEQYKDSDDTERQEWAEQAKMRANKTASTYNNFLLKNSYVWENNIPADIDYQLPYLN